MPYIRVAILPPSGFSPCHLHERLARSGICVPASLGVNVVRCFLAFVFFAVGLLVAGTASGPASAAAVGPAGIVACSINAWRPDKDHKGLDIHAGPGTDTAVRARIPPPIEVGDKEIAIRIGITGWKDGWFRVDDAWWLPKDAGAPNIRFVFSGEGWVFTDQLRVSLADTYLYREPSDIAPLVAILDKDLPDGEEAGPDRFTVERLVGCRADWVKVEGTYLGTRLRGWARGTCANQATTCP